MRVLQPLRELGTPLADISQPMPWTACNRPLTPSSRARKCGRTGSRPRRASCPTSSSTSSRRARRTARRRSRRSSSGSPAARSNRVGHDDAAFSERSAKYLFSDRGHLARGRPTTTRSSPGCAIRGARSPSSAPGRRTSTSPQEEESVVDEAFGAKLEKLGADQGEVRPGQLLPPQQQHRPCRITVEHLRRPARAWPGLGLEPGHASAGRLGRSRGVHGGTRRGGIRPPRRVLSDGRALHIVEAESEDAVRARFGHDPWPVEMLDVRYGDTMGDPAAKLTGGCLCGGVRFEVSEPLVSSGYCHCTRCQRRTGTAASASGRIAPGSLAILSGEELIRPGIRPDHGFSKVFCSQCGSALWSQSQDDPESNVRLGAFDGDPGIRPSTASSSPMPRRGSRSRTTGCPGTRSTASSYCTSVAGPGVGQNVALREWVARVDETCPTR